MNTQTLKKFGKKAVKTALFNLVVTLGLVLGAGIYNLQASQLDKAKQGLNEAKSTTLGFIKFLALDIACPILSLVAFVVAATFFAFAWKDVSSGAASKKNTVVACVALLVGILTGSTAIWSIFFS